MEAVAAGALLVAAAVRTITLVLGTAAAAVLVVDWVVRTRRVHPFHPVARVMRRSVDPLLLPVERRVVRAGGMPASAPLWVLGGVVIGGLLLVAGINSVARTIADMAFNLSAGPRGLLIVLVTLTFTILRFALLIVVLSSWIPGLSPYSPWVRPAFAVTDPLLRPLRSALPSLGPLDISPLVLYFLLGLLESAILSI